MPYLIQRASINSKNIKPESKISDFTDFEYMGASEFECGDLAKSIRMMYENKSNYIQFIVSCQNKKVFVYAKKDQQLKITQFIEANIKSPIPKEFITKERTDLFESLNNNSKTNFWIDIKNAFAFSSNEENLNIFLKGLENSITHMDKVKNEISYC